MLKTSAVQNCYKSINSEEKNSKCVPFLQPEKNYLIKFRFNDSKFSQTLQKLRKTLKTDKIELVNENKSIFLSEISHQDSKIFLDQTLFTPLSKQKANKFKSKSLSYNNQRLKSVKKTQNARKDMEEAQQLKISQFYHDVNKIRFKSRLNNFYGFAQYINTATSRNYSEGFPFRITQIKRSTLHNDQHKKVYISSPKKIISILTDKEKIKGETMYSSLYKYESISAWEVLDQKF